MVKRHVFTASLALGGLGLVLGHEGCGSEQPGVTTQPRAPEVRKEPSATDKQLAMARAAIRHVVIIMQENRSFDHYFGTFPGADGIPMKDGRPTVCAPTRDGKCIHPFHDRRDENSGGPHDFRAHERCVAGGRMDGFVESFLAEVDRVCRGSTDPDCSSRQPEDVMGYHDDRELPNYWAYAKAFTLQDHMFTPAATYSLPTHLYMVSAWSATCSPKDDPTACRTALYNPGDGHDLSASAGSSSEPPPEYPWTDITYLLHKSGVSWKYFVTSGTTPDCADGAMKCDPQTQDYKYPSYWNVLPWFDDVVADGETGYVADTSDFFAGLRAGHMAAVNWIIPSGALSEHPSSLVSAGQAYVTEVVNAVMRSPLWNSTAVFISWDDWGGFYDHVVPVQVDKAGYGIRVPGITLSPWVKPHRVDHQVYSHDAYLRLIEDLFLNGERLDPARDGRRDNRPTVRETVPELADLLSEFDFEQKPNPPLVLSPCPPGVDTEWAAGSNGCTLGPSGH
jgi:phospholipase C